MKLNKDVTVEGTPQEVINKIVNAQPSEYRVDGHLCCHIGCNNNADYLIQGINAFEDYTHMCEQHVAEYVGDEDTILKL